MVTPTRVKRLIICVSNVFESYEAGLIWFDVTNIVSVVGQIISMQTVFGSVVRLRTRYLYFCIMNHSSWNSSVMLSEKTMSELIYWFTSVDRINESGATLSQLTKEDFSSVVVYCDASDTGFGGHLTMGSDIEQTELECYGLWNEWENRQSSTWRELKTVKRILTKSVDII